MLPPSKSHHPCAARRWTSLLLFLLLLARTVSSNKNTVLVVGSINLDTFLPIARMPTEGENVGLSSPASTNILGGKGCTQAVAACKLLKKEGSLVKFVGQFGNDGPSLSSSSGVLDELDLSSSTFHETVPYGRGYVFLIESTGSVSAIVSPGANGKWKGWSEKWQQAQQRNYQYNDAELLQMFGQTQEKEEEEIQCVMLQCEVPEYVNLLVAKYATHYNIPVVLDVGGEDRPICKELIQLCTYIMPNESELERLCRSMDIQIQSSKDLDMNDHEHQAALVIAKAQALQRFSGAPHVLVTRGSQGSILVMNQRDRVVYRQAPFPLKQVVVDETGAGDCFRAAFCVSHFLYKTSLEDSLEFAAAAGACAVTKAGAVPATPTRTQVLNLLKLKDIPRGGGADPAAAAADDFPFLIGSRLNSMKDRPELYDHPLKNPKDYVQRQATIKGLTCVDFNYPQHFTEWTSREAKETLEKCNLRAGAVCLRYPSPKFVRGAMNHPDAVLRQEAIELTKEAAQVALDLGCNEVVVWSAFDGYDYPFQVNYQDKWNQLIDAFRECCDAYPSIKFSLEYKPTDENTRFFTVPTTGAAILLVNQVDRPNFGLTLDVGHMLMAGENPAQSIAMAGKKVFGVQLNDGYTRLAAEDGLMFGSVHPSMALELMYQLRKNGFAGHFYFDTFPQRTDPVKECEYNIRKLKQFWKAVGSMSEKEVQRIAGEHDALGALALVDAALRSM